MYVGDYLDSNLGHEVINLFKADNGNHYIYLNATGNFAKEHSGKIGYMLFVKYYDKGLVEIIGMATGLNEVPGADMQLNRERKFDGIYEDIWQLQKSYIDAQTNEQGEKVGISYGGVSILDIFNNAEQQSIFVTYKADKVYRIKSSIRRFIRFSNADENSGANLPANEIIQLAEHQQAKASLKQYIYPSDSSDYGNLFALFNDSSLWEEVDVVDAEKLSIETQRKVSLFDICKIQNDENRFSNALAYFMERSEYYELWTKFFAKYGINLKKNFTVAREESAKIESTEWNHEEKPSGGRVDLLIRDGENIAVIENKIKSDINTIATDGDDSLDSKFKANLVITLTGTAMTNSICTLCLSDLYNTLCDNGTSKRSTKKILFILSSRHNCGDNIIINKLICKIFDIALGSTGLDSLFLKSLKFVTLSNVSAYGDNFAVIIVFLKPRNYDRCIKSSGICKPH